MAQESKSQECCPLFNPDPWNDKVFEWSGKRFIKDKVWSLFNIPVNFGAVMTRMNKRVEASGAQMPDCLCLSDHTSMWNIDVYLAVDREVPGAENLTLSGKYISKVYEGPYGEIGKWIKDFQSYAHDKGVQIKKQYMWYTTCPKCAQKHDKNHVVFIAGV